MLIRVEGLRVVYPGGVEALSGASMEARAGELVALVGPNGGGKTTLLRTLAGLIPSAYPASVEGLVEVDGYDPRGGVNPRLAVYMQPDPTIQVVGVTVLHEAILCPSMMGLSPREARERALGAVAATGLRGLEGEPIPLLSSGVLQRAAIAGMLSCRPRYLLLDEPTGHLDPEAGQAVVDLLSSLARSGLGVLASTHDERLVEKASRVYTVDRGIVEGSWTPPPLQPRAREGGPAELGEVLLEARGLAAGYPGGPPVVRAEVLQARAGELVALVGPNGGGKTTLLRTLAGFLRPMKGRVVAHARRAYLPANPLLVFSRPTLSRELGGRRPPIPVEGLMDRPIMWLSSGQLQLAALAVVASSGARILLLDEPTHALDPVNRGVVTGALRELANAGYAIVAATHDKDLARVADNVVRVEGGVARL